MIEIELNNVKKNYYGDESAYIKATACCSPEKSLK